MKTATLITAALLAPFWWGMGLLVLALIGDLSLSTRQRVARVLGNLEDTPRDDRLTTALPERHAA